MHGRLALVAAALGLALAAAGGAGAETPAVVKDPGTLGGLLRPYVSAGVPVGADAAAGGMPWALQHTPPPFGDAPVSLGAGLGVRLMESVDLYGEYRFLHVRPDVLRPDPTDRVSPGREGVDIKGGLHFRF
jgi:hypothetical protein